MLFVGSIGVLFVADVVVIVMIKWYRFDTFEFGWTVLVVISMKLIVISVYFMRANKIISLLFISCINRNRLSCMLIASPHICNH